MSHRALTHTASASISPGDAWQQLDAALAHLTTLIAAIEADCASSGVPTALARNRVALYAAMDALGGWINTFLAARPSAADIQTAKDRITGLIRPWSATGPFFDRSYGKLRGYPGDFETIEIIYNCRSSGVDLRAQIFDDYYLWTVAARRAQPPGVPGGPAGRRGAGVGRARGRPGARFEPGQRAGS